MSEVIELLAKMASDASINSERAYTELVLNADINEQQQQAILNKDIKALANTCNDLPLIQSVFIIPAEDDEPSKDDDKEESTEANNKFEIAVNE